jgi:hypothetical protein
MNTVFIIGAGASNEIGIPLGETLKKKIADIFQWKSEDISLEAPDSAKKNVYYATEIFHKGSYDTQKGHFNAGDNTMAWVKNLSFADSIDNFISNNRDKEDVVTYCKIGIIQAILQAEQNCKMYNKSRDALFTKYPIAFNEIENTYFIAMWKKIKEGCLYDELIERLKQITFIVFNYDRALEYFLFNIIRTDYNKEIEEAARAVNEVKIMRPYGQVGYLSCLKENGIPFGAYLKPQQLVDLCSSIKTFNEVVDTNNVIYKTMEKSLIEAQKLIFLGFAFHAQNLELLFNEDYFVKSNTFRERSNLPEKSLKIYGTCYKLPAVSQSIIKEKLRAIASRVSCDGFYNGACRDFFSEYSIPLSFIS